MNWENQVIACIQKKDIHQGILKAKKWLDQEPKNSAAHHFLGYLYLQNQQTNQALNSFYKAVSLPDAQPNFFENCLKVLKQLNQNAKIIELATVAQKRFEKEVNFDFYLGEAFYFLGDFQKANAYFQNCIQRGAQVFNSSIYLGLTWAELNQIEQALALFHKLRLQQPENLELIFHLGRVYQKKEDDKKAIDLYEKLRAKNFIKPELYSFLAKAYLADQKPDKAKIIFEEGINKHPTFLNLWLELAKFYFSQSDYQQVFKVLAEAEKRLGKTGQILHAKGYYLSQIGDYQKAKQAYQMAIVLDKNLIQSQLNLILLEIENPKSDFIQIQQTLEKLKKEPLSFFHQDWLWQIEYFLLLKEFSYEKAYSLCQKILAKRPADKLWQLRSCSLLVDPHDPSFNNKQNEQLAKLLDQLNQTKEKFDFEKYINLPYPSYLMAMHGKNYRELREKYATFIQNQIPVLKINPHHEKKQRIGFVVTDGHEGIFIQLFLGILKSFDLNKWQLYFFGGQRSLARIKQSLGDGPSFYKINSLPKRAATEINKHQIDLLYYWEIGTDFLNYWLSFYKPALVQITSWGFPLTSGNNRVDYFLSTQKTLENKKDYSEELAQIESLPCFYEKIEINPKNNRAQFGLPTLAKVIGLPHSPSRLCEDFDFVLRNILKKHPECILVLLERITGESLKKFKARFEKNLGPCFKQVHFLPALDPQTYLLLVSCFDLMLDPIGGFAGGQTSSQALNLDIPIVTLPGPTLAGQATHAIYQAMGHLELIAKNQKHYLKLVDRLLKKPKFYAKQKEAIHNKKHLFLENSQTALEIQNLFETWIEKAKRNF